MYATDFVVFPPKAKISPAVWKKKPLTAETVRGFHRLYFIFTS
jgi:hypothetical protein